MKFAALALTVSFGLTAAAEQYEVPVDQDIAATTETYEEFLNLEDEQDGAQESDAHYRVGRTVLRCVSFGRGTTGYCQAPGRIVSVRLVREFSDFRCRAGRTYGFAPRYMWVRRGCAGDFVVRYRW